MRRTCGCCRASPGRGRVARRRRRAPTTPSRPWSAPTGHTWTRVDAIVVGVTHGSTRYARHRRRVAGQPSMGARGPARGDRRTRRARRHPSRAHRRRRRPVSGKPANEAAHDPPARDLRPSDRAQSHVERLEDHAGRLRRSRGRRRGRMLDHPRPQSRMIQSKPRKRCSSPWSGDASIGPTRPSRLCLAGARAAEAPPEPTGVEPPVRRRKLNNWRAWIESEEHAAADFEASDTEDDVLRRRMHVAPGPLQCRRHHDAAHACGIVEQVDGPDRQA